MINRTTKISGIELADELDIDDDLGISINEEVAYITKNEAKALINHVKEVFDIS